MDDRVNKLEERNLFLEKKVLELQEDNLAYAKERETINQTLRDMCGINNEVMIHISKIINDQTTLDVNQNSGRISGVGYRSY